MLGDFLAVLLAVLGVITLYAQIKLDIENSKRKKIKKHYYQAPKKGFICTQCGYNAYERDLHEWV